MKYLKKLWTKIGDNRFVLFASGAGLAFLFQDIVNGSYWWAALDLYVFVMGYFAWKNIGRTQQVKEVA